MRAREQRYPAYSQSYHVLPRPRTRTWGRGVAGYNRRSKCRLGCPYLLSVVELGDARESWRRIDHEGPWQAGVGLGYLLRYGEARWRDLDGDDGCTVDVDPLFYPCGKAQICWCWCRGWSILRYF